MTTETVVLRLNDLLEELKVRRWTLYRWGPGDDPSVLVGLYHWTGAIDGIILQANGKACSFRCPDNTPDVFRPNQVMFQWAGESGRALRTVLSLAEPNQPGAPIALMAPAPECAIPGRLPNPFVIRPVSACHEH